MEDTVEIKASIAASHVVKSGLPDSKLKDSLSNSSESASQRLEIYPFSPTLSELDNSQKRGYRQPSNETKLPAKKLEISSDPGTFALYAEAIRAAAGEKQMTELSGSAASEVLRNSIDSVIALRNKTENLAKEFQSLTALIALTRREFESDNSSFSKHLESAETEAKDLSATTVSIIEFTPNPEIENLVEIIEKKIPLFEAPSKRKVLR